MRERVGALLPVGSRLPSAQWLRRHRAVVVLLWLNALAIAIVTVAKGYGLAHTVFEVSVVPMAAVVAMTARSRRIAAVAASVGLLSASAVLVHLSGGYIELHFHFFVMVAVIALYQDWLPFLMAATYVFVHHGIVGVMAPESVYNHPAAIENPWPWAGVHGGFIAGLSAVCLVTWRFSESMLDDSRVARERAVRESRMFDRLSEVAKALAAEVELPRVMQKVTDAGTEMTEAAFGAFFVNVEDGSGGSYLLHTLAGASEADFAGFGEPRKTAVFAPTFDGVGPVRMDDVTADPRYGNNPPHHGMPKGHLPVRSYLAVPVMDIEGGVLGGLFFGHPEPAKFTADHERLAMGIASHAAVAVRNARLHESEHRAREAAERARARVTLLADASRVLASSLELDVVLTRLAEVVVPDMADTCMVYLVGDDGVLRLVTGAAVPELLGGAKRPTPRHPIEANPDGPVVAAVKSGSAVLVPDIDDDYLVAAIDDPTFLPVVRHVCPTTAAIVPLRGRERILGAIVPGTVKSSGRRLGPDDLELAEELAQRAAVAIDNAKVFATQRTAAEVLQHSLLPDRLPEIPGVQTAARYQPGGVSLDVGGDWYDVFLLPDGSVGLVMGDALGHGLAAATVMGQVRNALRALALEGHPPAQVLARLDRMLDDTGTADTMVTLVYCTFDPRSGVLRLANAGHPPPLVLGPTAEPEHFGESLGIPLGAGSPSCYREAVTTLAPGATIVLYTDGLVEDRGVSLDEGLARLRHVLRAGETSPDVLCGDALEGMLEGRTVEDDVAMLAMRYLPLGERVHFSLPPSPSVLKPLRSTLTRWLAQVGAPDDAVFDTAVACTEAVTNALRHGCARDDTFDVWMEAGDTIEIRVASPRPWRPQGGRPGGGRGLAVMRELMDEVDIRTSPDGVEVVMRRSRQGATTPTVS